MIKSATKTDLVYQNLHTVAGDLQKLFFAVTDSTLTRGQVAVELEVILNDVLDIQDQIDGEITTLEQAD